MQHKVMKLILGSVMIMPLLTACISSTPKDSERISGVSETTIAVNYAQNTTASDTAQSIDNTLNTTQATSLASESISSSAAVQSNTVDANSEKQNLLNRLQMNLGDTTAEVPTSTAASNIQNSQASQNNQLQEQTQATDNLAVQQPIIPNSTQETNATVDSGMGYIEQKSFGSYMIPSGWSEWTYHSTDSKWFYTKGTPKNEDILTNISVQCYTNDYTQNDYESFLKDLVVFYKKQLTQQEYDSMQMEGISSSKGYPIVKVSISNTDGRKTVQYYIIGDYKHVLIHLTDFNDEIKDGDTAALYIVDSFVWAG